MDNYPNIIIIKKVIITDWIITQAYIYVVRSSRINVILNISFKLIIGAYN